jgi:hypothetical protein
MGGLEAGIQAAIPLFLWLAVLGVVQDRFWWAGFNLCAWPFFGDRVFEMGLSRATLTGASFLLLHYGALGFFLGLWFRPESAWGVMVRGLILGMAWHFFADRWFWGWVSPYSGGFFQARLVLPGHLLWSLFLLRYKSRYEAVGRTFGDPERWPPEAVEEVVEEAMVEAGREAEPVEFTGPMPELPPGPVREQPTKDAAGGE